MKASSAVWVSLAGLGLVACAGTAKPDPVSTEAASNVAQVAYVEGQVLYRERMMLPPGAEVDVVLQDVSRADAPAEEVARQSFPATGGPPFDFRVDYAPTAIDPRHRYQLRATITAGGGPLFASHGGIDAFAAGPREIVVKRVAPAGSSSGPLVGTHWALRSFEGDPVEPSSVLASTQLDFSEEGVSGSSGCNRFSGPYSVKPGTLHGTGLSLGPLAATKRACAEGGDAEQRYLSMLDRVTGFRLGDGTLSVLAGPDVIAVFVPKSP